MQPNWTISRGVRHWRKRLEIVGGGRSRRPLKPQTLAGYDSEIVRIIDPTMGQVRLEDVSIALIEELLGTLEQQGISTERARDVLNGTFNLAARDDAVRRNPMPYVALPAREPKEVEALDVVTARFLLRAVHRDYRRTRGKRRPNRDLHDVVVLLARAGAPASWSRATARWRSAPMSAATSPSTTRTTWRTGNYDLGPAGAWNFTGDTTQQMGGFNKARWGGYRAQGGLTRRQGDERELVNGWTWLECFADRIRSEGLAGA